MNAVTKRTGMFTCRLEQWKHARAFLENFCRTAGVRREKCLKANLVVEELFLNSVKHGHHGGSDAPVWIELTAEGEHVRLTYEDLAPPFNPFAAHTREMLEALAETRREGGLGIILANGLTASTEYAYLFGRNRIRLEVA